MYISQYIELQSSGNNTNTTFIYCIGGRYWKAMEKLQTLRNIQDKTQFLRRVNHTVRHSLSHSVSEILFQGQLGDIKGLTKPSNSNEDLINKSIRNFWLSNRLDANYWSLTVLVGKYERIHH